MRHHRRNAARITPLPTSDDGRSGGLDVTSVAGSEYEPADARHRRGFGGEQKRPAQCAGLMGSPTGATGALGTGKA